MILNSFLRVISAFFLLFSVLSCTPYMRQPLKPQRAIIGPESPAKKGLLGLPAPKEKIVAAVYKFRDQTGQYKPSENGANWSTAVTQGATTILIRALEESGWFIPIERENIANLLNERKIIRSSRAQYEGKDENSASLLPPLLFAGVILEGGIISYDTNILTGGAGIRYFGADASGQYREDRVSIYIRAVSTSNGKVLKTVYTTKSLLSQEVSFGIFRYVKAKRLLEAETGLTYNEPTEICITEAIEKAIESLVIEGIKDKLWALKESKDTASVAYTNYLEEKKINYDSDPFGRYVEKNRRGNVFWGLSGGVARYMGDYSSGSYKPKASGLIGFGLSNRFFMDAEIGEQYLTIKKKETEASYFGNLSLRYVFAPHEKFSPWIRAGGGMDFNQNSVGLSDKKTIPSLSSSVGIEYMMSKKIGLTIGYGVNYYLDDEYDGSAAGSYNDFNWGISAGVNFYIGTLRNK